MKAIASLKLRPIISPKSPINIVKINVGIVKIKDIATCMPILLEVSIDSCLYFLGSMCSSDPKPPALMALSIIFKSLLAPSTHLTVAFSRGRLTFTDSMPSRLPTMDSTDATQDAHVIPVIRIVDFSMCCFRRGLK